MYENFAWNYFISTGNIETYLEYKEMIRLKEKGEVTNEAYKSKGNSNT